MADEKEAATRLIGDAADVEEWRVGYLNHWTILGLTIPWQLLAGVAIILSFPVGLYFGQSIAFICFDSILVIVLLCWVDAFGPFGGKKEE